MPKQKKFTPLSDIEQELKSKTRNLYEQSAAQAANEALAEAQTAAARKRRKPESTIPRQNGKLLFLEERHIEAIEQVHWTSKVDRQDVIRTAIDDFLARHFNGEHLDEEGQQKVKAYYEKTHR